MSPRAWWLVVVLVAAIACLPVLPGATSGAGSQSGHAGVSHDELHAAQAKHPGFGVELGHIVVEHPHADAAQRIAGQGIDGIDTLAVRSMTAPRLLTVLTAIWIVAAFLVVVFGLHPLRGPPHRGVWCGPVRTGRIVLADFCVIRR